MSAATTSSGILHHNGEEGLQIERHRPKRVRSDPTSHELEIQIDDPMAQQITAFTRRETVRTRVGKMVIPAP